MKFFLLLIFLSTAPLKAYSTQENIVLDVPGMVCQMCVQGMKATFGKKVKKGADNVSVNLDDKFVVLHDLKKEFSTKKLLKKTKKMVKKSLKPLENSVNAGYEADLVVYNIQFKNGFSKNLSVSDITIKKGSKIILNFGKKFKKDFKSVKKNLESFSLASLESKDAFQKQGKRKVLELTTTEDTPYKSFVKNLRERLGTIKLASGV